MSFAAAPLRTPISDRLHFSCRRRITEAEDRTYAQLDQQARAIAAQLATTVVGRAIDALLMYDAGLDYIAALAGCLYAGHGGGAGISARSVACSPHAAAAGSHRQ